MKTWEDTGGNTVAGNLHSCCFCNNDGFYPKKTLALEVRHSKVVVKNDGRVDREPA
jgi:hypothetical protein